MTLESERGMTNIYSMAIRTIFLIHPSKNKQIWWLIWCHFDILKLPGDSLCMRPEPPWDPPMEISPQARSGIIALISSVFVVFALKVRD